MKNKLFKKLAITICAIGMVALLFGCSANESLSIDKFTGEDYSQNSSAEIGSTSNIIEEISNERKIIETVELGVQTTKFEELLENTKNKIKELNGYVESSNISGREIGTYNNRWAEMKVKIPAKNSEYFKGFISESSVIIRESVTTEDITLKYVDIESRILALRSEQASLEKLLENAKSTSDIVTIRQQLTDVIYKIESYESQLRTFDNLVDYCTITLYIDEVERTTIVEDQSTWEEIGTNLSRNFEKVWDGIVALFIFFVSIIPYMIPFAIIGIIVLVIIKLCTKSRNKKSNKHNP